MNSMNHYAYGSIQEWMFRHVAGINTMESHPGARTVQFAPTLNWDLRYAEAKYDSASGMYSIRWELSDKEHVTITMDVPFDFQWLPKVKKKRLQKCSDQKKTADTCWSRDTMR